MWENRNCRESLAPSPTSQRGGGRALAEGSLSLYTNGQMFCLYSEPGWLVPGVQEQGARAMREEREQEVERETREHHALPTLRQGEGRCRRT